MTYLSPVAPYPASPVSSAGRALRRLASRRLLRWRARCTPANPQHASRSCLPWAGGPSRFSGLAPSSPSPACLLSCLGSSTQSTLLTQVSTHRSRWVLWTPLVGQVTLPPVAPHTPGVTPQRPCLGPSYLRSTLSQLRRGLGALCLLKLRYKGKSFKWHRRRASLMLRFGHAHLVFVRAWPGVRWRRRGKLKILLFGSSLPDLQAFGATVIDWRRMNVYHGRGLRLARQLVYRKSGKVSAYR